VRFVRGVLRATPHPEAVPTTLTCGAEEENINNNRLMAEALAAQGYGARLHEVRGVHDWKAWRRALHPHLTRLLSRVWE
jgi:enterochelin esterase family protein